MTIREADRATWLDARLELLAAEKSLQRERDRLAARRREMPLVRIDEDYRFDSADGELTLGELFGSCSQLVVYHSYSTYSRGLDPFDAAYQFLDILPRGRDEDGLDFPMAWVRRNDEYGRGR